MFVLDASITMAWCFPDEATARSDAVLDRLRVEGALVPAIWPLEVTNSLLLGERRDRLSEADVASFVRLVQSLPIIIDAANTLARIFGPVRALAKEQGLSSYDASYVDLALRESLGLATGDARMREAAIRLGVPLVDDSGIDG